MYFSFNKNTEYKYICINVYAMYFTMYSENAYVFNMYSNSKSSITSCISYNNSTWSIMYASHNTSIHDQQ